MREARGRGPPRRHCTPAPRETTHWGRLVRRAVLRAAPRAPGLASRELIYSDPDLTRQRGLGGRSGDYGWPPGACTQVQSSVSCCQPCTSGLQAQEVRCGGAKNTASASSKFDRCCKRGMWVQRAEMRLAPYSEV